MSKAEEFRKTWMPKDSNEDYINAFAEDYHQSRVKAISDEDIKNEFKGNLDKPYLLENLHKRDNFFKEFGAKWYKEQLLKQ